MNNDMLVPDGLSQFRMRMFNQTLFPTNEQFYTPNICAHTMQWKELLSILPLSLISSSVLETCSGDQIIHWIFQTERIDWMNIIHIPHNGSTYHRGYDHHQFALARILILLNAKLTILKPRLDAYNTDIRPPQYRSKFFQCKKYSLCYWVLEPALILASVDPFYSATNLLIRWRWIWFLEGKMLENNLPLPLVTAAFATHLALIIYCVARVSVKFKLRPKYILPRFSKRMVQKDDLMKL
jgi:hypothetical protein